jgi:hypothetical protein
MEDLRIAKSVISECQTMRMSIAIYFLTIIILLWNTPQISCLLILIVIIFLGKLTTIAKKSLLLALITLPGLRCEQFLELF